MPYWGGDVKKEGMEFTQFLGINKGEHHSGIALLSVLGDVQEIQVWGKERLSQKKNAGGMPFQELKAIQEKIHGPLTIADNSFGHHPRLTEKLWDENYPFFSLLKKKELEQFSSHLNPHIQFISHHAAHAWAALAQSPFTTSLILVMDGVGQDEDAFPVDHAERVAFPCNDKILYPRQRFAESATLYLQERGELRVVDKIWQRLVVSETLHDEEGHDPEDFSTGLGHFYALAAKYIFNSFHDSGKVMGLAAFGQELQVVKDPLQFWQEQDWSRRFRGKSKKDWQESADLSHWANIAASVQAYFERELMDYLRKMKERFPTVENLILTGGCALNCVANQKVLQSHLFKEVFVPAFPSDEGISFGLAQALFYQKYGSECWRPTSLDQQKFYLGPKSSVPDDFSVIQAFTGYPLVRLHNVAQEVAQLLAQGKVVAWFQGQSETGPRALGHRSILADPKIVGLKERLNQEIKKRENFRPYGASLRQQDVAIYFQEGPHFWAPFMSFAPKLRPEFHEMFASITHVDGTCRVQTLAPEHDQLFYQLLTEFEKISGYAVLLNTSLNIMGRPIVETLEHAREFFEETCVDVLVVGNFKLCHPA